MRPIGFSTGAVAKHDFTRALDLLRHFGVRVVELSALRLGELAPLVNALQQLDLDEYEFVSFHAPSRIEREDEMFVTETLCRVTSRGVSIVVHPDVVFTPELWLPFGPMLLLENMDKRKPIGRTARELDVVFRVFPEAKFCFDIGHARQVDPTMIEARLILERFASRLAQVHISEVNTASRHDPLSYYARAAFQTVANLIPENVPVILETLIDRGQSDIPTEITHAADALSLTNEAYLALR
jgi:hypothetical protein